MHTKYNTLKKKKKKINKIIPNRKKASSRNTWRSDDERETMHAGAYGLMDLAMQFKSKQQRTETFSNFVLL